MSQTQTIILSTKSEQDCGYSGGDIHNDNDRNQYPISPTISGIHIPSIPEPAISRSKSQIFRIENPGNAPNPNILDWGDCSKTLEMNNTNSKSNTPSTFDAFARSGLSREGSRVALRREWNESDRGSTVTVDSVGDKAKQRAEQRMYRTVLASFFFMFFLLGLNDGSIGPLLPVYQDYYQINFLKVSMIFISNCLGCLTSAFLNVFLSSRIAFSKILTLAALLQMTAYAIMTSAPKPFVIMCIGFFINGMGMSFLNAQGNAILSMLHNPTSMGIAHASYGTGALIAPLISTQFAEMHIYSHGSNGSSLSGSGHHKAGTVDESHRWSYYYSILMSTAILDAFIILGVFRGRGYEQVLKLMGVKSVEAPSKGDDEGLKLKRVNARDGLPSLSSAPISRVGSRDPSPSLARLQSSLDPSTFKNTYKKSNPQAIQTHSVHRQSTAGDLDLDAVERASESSSIAQGNTRGNEGPSFIAVLKQVHVHILAAFVFIYVGTEVTIGGWIVTFMINERGGGASSGYVSSGFFGGLALGRVALLHVNRLLGERNAVFLYTALGIALEITVWFVPSLIGNAIAVSLVGMMLGPFYPIVMSQTGRLIPRKVLSGSIGWIAGFGQSGSAVLPFLTGALANKYGIKALQPLIVAMMTSMGALWFMVPNVAKRKE